MTPPASVARPDLEDAGSKSSEDGIETRQDLVHPSLETIGERNLSIDEATVTFRRQPNSLAQSKDARLNLDQTDSDLSEDSNVAEAIDTGLEAGNDSPSRGRIGSNYKLLSSKLRSELPIRSKLSSGYCRSKGELRTRPSHEVPLAIAKADTDRLDLETITDLSRMLSRRRLGESTDSDDGEEAAPSSGRRAETRSRPSGATEFKRLKITME